MAIQNLIFDLGNVIIPLKDEKEWWNQDFLDIFSNPVAINDLRNGGFFVQYEKGEITTIDFLNTLKIHLKSEFQVSDIIDRWNVLLKSIPNERLRFIEKLKKKYKIYLLSNTNEIHLNFILQNLEDRYPFDKVFDKCFYSFQMDDVKPNKSIYIQVLESIASPVYECLFLDDKLENIQAAKSLGMQTLLVDKNQEISDLLSEF